MGDLGSRPLLASLKSVKCLGKTGCTCESNRSWRQRGCKYRTQSQEKVSWWRWKRRKEQGCLWAWKAESSSGKERRSGMKRAVDTRVSVGVYEEAKHSRVFLGQRVSWYIHQNPLGT